MESVNRTPNENESRGDDIKLRAELNEALEQELEQSPDKMDTKKIDSIISLLNHLQEEGAVVQEVPKDVYARKYLRGVIKYREKRMRSARAAMFFIGIILCVSICNWISVKATDKNLFHFVRERAYLFYYETVGNSREESDSRETTNQLRDVSEDIYESWEELMGEKSIQILVPAYIPEDLEALPIHAQGVTQKDMGISRQYTDGEFYVIFLIRAMSGYGKMLYSEDLNTAVPEKKIVNEIEVFLYELDDKLQAVFQNEQFMYCIESNMNETEVIKIIEEMR
ncbi:MAG: DUF4367 domain-containing protein [Lachnospiraceae bacterium]|nr:DUF4367 domain-containing protein [Lachnospiraceae bacterium]